MSGKETKIHYNLREKYNSEISRIKEIINLMKTGRLYGEGFTGSNSDGSLSENALKIERLMDDLLNKIQNGLDSDEEKMGEEVKKAFYDN